MALDYGTMIDRFFQGYDYGSKYMAAKEKRDTAAKTKEDAAALATALATGFDSSPKVDQQAQMLKEQTAGMSDTAIPEATPTTAPKPPPGPYKAVNAKPESAIPPVADNIGVTPEKPDPRIQELEAMVTKEQGSPIMKQQNWKDFEAGILKKAGAIGDPDTVVKTREYLTNLKASGMRQNLMGAKMAMLNGDDKAANHYVQRAWGYMADGNIPQLMPVGKGQYVATSVDENTGKPSAPPVGLDSTAIDQMIMLTENPAEFAKFTQMQEERLLEKGTPEERKAARALASEKAAIDLQTAKAKSEEAGYKAQEAKAKAGGQSQYTEKQWDTKVKSLNDYITNTYQKSDEFSDIPEEQIGEFRQLAEGIMSKDKVMSPQAATQGAREVLKYASLTGSRPGKMRIMDGKVYIPGPDGNPMRLSDALAGS
jgi:hypothetical protein